MWKPISVPEFLSGDPAADLEQMTAETEGLAELWVDPPCITAHVGWGLAVCFARRAASTGLGFHVLL